MSLQFMLARLLAGEPWTACLSQERFKPRCASASVRPDVALVPSSGSSVMVRQPPVPSRLTIASDGERAGREAAHALAERAAALGWAVSMLPAPDGADWNVVLMGKAVLAWPL